jgi:cycloeucalenol cycloisomerase
VPFKLYDRLDEWGYLAVGLAAALPCVLLPLLVLKPEADAKLPLRERYWVKANVWIAIFSHIGNYFWTHYFFNLLGARYTFPAHLLNGVPIALYLMTHAYFCFYHALANVVLRRVETALVGRKLWVRKCARALIVFLLAYATAYGETLTIAHFPYYTFVDRGRMYTVGSLFYAIYFWVSFPLFMRIDEHEWGTAAAKSRWTLRNVALDALAAGMLVTILLDAWRLAVGGIVEGNEEAAKRGLQWAASAVVGGGGGAAAGVVVDEGAALLPEEDY